MGFFGSTDTVDGKARDVLGDLSEDPAPFEILQTVDQKAGDDVDPDDVVQRMRDLDEAVDTKLASVEGDAVDHKDMRAAAGALADETPLSQPAALELLSAVEDAVERLDPSILVDAFDSATAGEHLDEDAVDQNAQPDDTPDTDMGDTNDTPTDPDSTDPDANATPDPDPGDDPAADGVDQKQDNDDGGDDGDQMSALDLVEEIGGSDAADTVEEFADSVNKDVQDAAAEWVAENVPGVTVEGHGDSGGDDAAPADPAPDQNTNQPDQPDRNANTGADVDQMLEDVDLNERVADAVTSEEVIDEMAGAVAQKMATNDDLADNLVETVDQKGDFVTTEDTVTTAPTTDAETVGESAPITGGDDE